MNIKNEDDELLSHRASFIDLYEKVNKVKLYKTNNMYFSQNTDYEFKTD